MSVKSHPGVLTPVELRAGRFYKRDDLHRDDIYGVNGSKFRACRHLMQRAKDAGATRVISASSVRSPQAAIAGVLAQELGLECTIVLGSTTSESAMHHVPVQIAAESGARLNVESKSAFNPALQKVAARLAEAPGAWQLPYGITTAPGASREEVEAFLAVGGRQVMNLPEGIETLVVPFGSGNTASAILYGLRKIAAPHSLRRVVLVGVGPDRMDWMLSRLFYVGVNLAEAPFRLEHLALHDWWAGYLDKMPETVDGITMHPTYEGKVVRFLNAARPTWWTARDEKTCMWIVGGPIE